MCMDPDELLTTTRAVRRKLDLDRPVDDDVLLECLRIAVQAPTPGGSEQWRWLIIRDQEMKNAIGRIFREQGDSYMQWRRAGITETTPAIERAFASGQHLVDIIERVPVFVIPCIMGRPTGGNDALSVFYGGIFPAVWNFQLALRSRGLGSTLTSYHLGREAEAARILGIPEDVTQVGLLPIAYTTQQNFRPAARTPVEQITYYDRWLMTRTP